MDDFLDKIFKAWQIIKKIINTRQYLLKASNDSDHVSLSWLGKSKFSLVFMITWLAFFYVITAKLWWKYQESIHFAGDNVCYLSDALLLIFQTLMWFLCRTVTLINDLITRFVSSDCIFLIPFQLLSI